MLGQWLEGCQLEPQYGLAYLGELSHRQGVTEQGSRLWLSWECFKNVCYDYILEINDSLKSTDGPFQ